MSGTMATSPADLNAVANVLGRVAPHAWCDPVWVAETLEWPLARAQAACAALVADGHAEPNRAGCVRRVR